MSSRVGKSRAGLPSRETIKTEYTLHEPYAMYISDFAIKRPMVTVVTMVALVMFGLFALSELQTDEFPEIQQPVLLVSIPYPGAAPDGVEQEVLEPVEEAFTGISGVDQIFGTATDGHAQVLILFQFEKDMQEASQDVRDAISRIRSDLPVEMEEPILQRIDPADMPIVSLVLSSETQSSARLTRIADPEITRVLRGVPGVAQVNVVGGIERELTVELRPDALASMGIGVTDIVQALQAQNLASPVGRLNGEDNEQAIRLEGRLAGPDAFGQIIVRTGVDGRQVRLEEVATVSDGTEEARSIALFNEEEAIGIDVVKARGYSTTAVSQAIHEQVDQLRPSLPAGTRLEVIRDAGERVAASVWDVQVALAEGALLTVLVVFFFLNSWRSTVITGLALPVSVLAAFIAVWACGFTLNVMSLLGLSLAIGILIDDAIVVRENIVRHVEMGKSHLQAAREGTAQIGLAVAATTFSIVAVFIPVAFMGGVAGQWFKPFALTIACSVLVSLFVSFSLDPMLSAYWPDPHRDENERGRLTRLLDRFNAGFNRLSMRYRRVVAWALDHPKSMVGLAALSFIGALALPATGLVGAAFFGTDDRSELSIQIETPPGSSLALTRAKAEAISRLVRAHPEVRYAYAAIGAAEGSVDAGNLYIRLVKPNERDRSAEEFAALLRSEIEKIAGVTASVFTNDMQGGYKQIQIQLRGRDPETLQQAADRVLEDVRTVPGAVDVDLSTRGRKSELKIALHRDEAGVRGVTAGQVAQALRPAFAGLDAGDWIDNEGETRDVVVRLDRAFRERAEDLAWLPLRIAGDDGPKMLSLWEVASIEKGLGPAVITHLDRDNVITVEANVSGRPLSEVMKDIEARLESTPLPPGVWLTQGGEVESQQEVFGQIFASLGLGLMLMYLILALQFGSFLDPLAIMLSLPLSLIGVMLALLFTGSTVNIMSLIGVILLMGIVAKNAILLIDFAKEVRASGAPIRDALIEAGATRLRPILMTTVALIAGMIPVAFGAGEGAQFRQPLGVAVIGGTITSTLLTLLVIPVAYEILDMWRTRLAAKLAGWSRRTRRKRAAPIAGSVIRAGQPAPSLAAGGQAPLVLSGSMEPLAADGSTQRPIPGSPKAPDRI